jgi:outer membrane biosynthesis protein TonB
MNPRTLQTIAFALGCILALQSATTAFAQSAATGANPDPQQPVASPPAATAPPAEQAPDSATSGGGQEPSPYPEAPEPQTQDVKESLRVQQTKEAAKTQDPSRDALQQPKGAAAARVQPTTGTAASQPAGAAIAPAKQKRSRSFLIGLGVLAGAGIALGAVVALSSASPSKPPGSR